MTTPGDRRAIVLAGHRGDATVARSGLTDVDPAVRAAALGAVARCAALDPADVVTALVDDAAPVRRRAAEEAARLRDPVVADALLTALADAEDTVVEAAAYALGELEDPPEHVVAPLATVATTHPEVVVRESAVAALGSLAAALDPESAAALEAILVVVLRASEDVATVRRRAVLALAPFEDERAEEALTRLMADRDRQTRQSAEDLKNNWGGNPP